jgi:hypothetical protein
MKLTLHILTACSRTEGLPAIEQALDCLQSAQLDVHWHIGYDLERQHVGGQAVKNALLDSLHGDGYVWICDDDNLPHPNLALLPDILEPNAPGLLVAQERAPGRIVEARPELNHIDAAQIIVKASLIGGERIPETYNGDGRWIIALHRRLHLSAVRHVLAYYNRQRWPELSTTTI